jgi:hypothetical protein
LYSYTTACCHGFTNVFQFRADNFPELVQFYVFLFQVANQFGNPDRLPVQPRKQVFLFVTMM